MGRAFGGGCGLLQEASGELVTGAESDVGRGQTLVVAEARIRSRPHQQPHHFQMTVECGRMEGGFAVLRENKS